MSDILFRTEWTREKAWWLGVTMGDGYSCNDKGRRRLTLVSADKDILEKWIALTDHEGKEIKQRKSRETPEHDFIYENAYYAEIGDMRLTEWLASYNMDGKKLDLLFPPDLPAKYYVDFIRGLWDTDGHVGISKRVGNRRDTFVTFFLNKCFNLVDGVNKIYPQLNFEIQKKTTGPYIGYEYPAVGLKGEAAYRLMKEIYFEAPEHIRCNRKYEVVVKYDNYWVSSSRKCQYCDRIVIDRDVCAPCTQVKSRGKNCKECHSEVKPIIAKDLCKNCYMRHYKAERHILKDWNIQSSDFKYLADYNVAAWQEMSDIEQEKNLDVICDIYKKYKFPMFIINSREEPDVLDRVLRSNVTVENDIINPSNHTGYRYCDQFHFHRYETSYRNNKSVVAAYSDSTLLKNAIKFQLKQGDPVAVPNVIRALAALNKGPSNFSPALARWIVDTYCRQNGIVLDPCAGFGGRLLGCLASKKFVKYIGYDPEPKTYLANEQMLNMLNCRDRGEVNAHAIEHDNEWPKADIIFTGPPYYNTENYGHVTQGLLNVYNGYVAWLNGFWNKFIDKAEKSSDTVILNVGTFRQTSNKQIDYPQDVTDIFLARGWILSKKYDWKIATFGKTTKRKENILVFKKVQ